MFVRQFSLFVSFCLHHEYKIYPRERLVSVIIKWQEEEDVQLYIEKKIGLQTPDYVSSSAPNIERH